MLTLPQLRSLYGDAPPEHLAAFARQAPAAFRRARLDAAPQRSHFFLAQLGHESDGLRMREERLDYSVARLMQVWPRRFPTPEAARPYARNPEALANHVYAGRMGNDRPGDGYRYRGRGYIQITGREAYRAMGRRTGLPLEEQPELAGSPDHALAIACAFWAWKGLNRLCDAGDFTALTRRINGGLVGLQDRFGWLERVQRLMPWTGPEPLLASVDQVKAVQHALRARGLYSGSIDGVLGRLSRQGLAALRAEEELPPGEGLDTAVLLALGLAMPEPVLA